MSEEIKEHFRQLLDAESNVESSKIRLRELKKLTGSILSRFRESATNEMIGDLAYTLYWNTDTSVTTIGELLGTTGRRASGMIGPYPSGRRCAQCGNDIYWKNRDERYQEGKQLRPIAKELCGDCEEARRQSRSQSWAQEQAKRAQYVDLLKAMPYKEYLATEHWQQIRASALRRAKFRCQLCNGQGVLEVHHRTYERRGEEASSDVIVLCRNCHSKFHEVKA